MSYQALYRKYRPTSFDEVVGQKPIIKTLQNAIKTNRISHAYLFCGPRGTGKTSIAKIFAKTLNCENLQNAPCGNCHNCELAKQNAHPDIIEIDAASNNGVDEVRNLIERVKYAPMEGKYKVYIIDEVHMMSTGAFNALLKTIEEPPAHVIFIFATTEVNKVLPTIISRCQRFDFSRVAKEDIVYRLDVVCKEENIKIDPEALELIAELSDGGMRDALSILDQCIAYSEDAITLEDVRTIYGVVTKNDLGDLLNLLYEEKVDDTIQFIHKIRMNGFDLKRFTNDFIHILKNSVIFDYSNQTTLIDPSTKKIIQSKFMNIPIEFRIHLMDLLMETYTKYPYASNISDYLEAALLKSISKSYISKEYKSINQTENGVKKEEIGSDISYDITPERADISKKTKKMPKNNVDLDVKEIYDVSRETNKKEESSEFTNEKIRFSTDFLLSLLVGADRKLRQKESEQMIGMEDYLVDIEYGKFASSLLHCDLIASGENYSIIKVNSELEANEINELEENFGFEHFMLKLVGREKKIFAITNEQHKDLIETFRQRRANNTLPKAAIIELKSIVQEEKGNSEEEQLKKVFPSIQFLED